MMILIKKKSIIKKTVTLFVGAVNMIVSSFIFVGCSQKTPTGATCVSCKPYFVRGSWHYPQRHYEYEEVGLASWYGDDFHGKQKATGEPFHKMSMTAAHKTLPLPAVVKVTNQRNGKSVVVVVDDRGPYVYTGRIIDLSYGAAKVLDLHRYKPSKVKVETLVYDSLKLSNYIARNCKKRRDPYGRSWSQIYFQEIAKINSRNYNSPRFIQTAQKYQQSKKEDLNSPKFIDTIQKYSKNQNVSKKMENKKPDLRKLDEILNSKDYKKEKIQQSSKTKKYNKNVSRKERRSI